MGQRGPAVRTAQRVFPNPFTNGQTRAPRSARGWGRSSRRPGPGAPFRRGGAAATRLPEPGHGCARRQAGAAAGVSGDEIRLSAGVASNGVFDRTGQWFVIWPLPEVVARNSKAWSFTDSQVRHKLVGFGDDGTGTPFWVPRDGSTGVFAWSAIDGEATLLADSVAAFWSGWRAGTLPTY
jgi:hypothetical protein